MTTIILRAPTPELTVNCLGTKQAGRCYTITRYEVRSTKKLQHAVFAGLRDAGMLGYGQGFSVSSPREEQELLVPVSIDEATGKVLAEGYEKVLNPYSRQPYKETYRTVYIYTVTSDCDSSD